MAGHYRVAFRSAQLGMPEVKLGLIPGAGGTQRLPRLVGPLGAAKMYIDGRPISAPDALAWGLTDRLVEGDLVEEAVRFAREVTLLGVSKTSERDDRLQSAELSKLEGLRTRVAREWPSRAPSAALQAIQASTT